MLKDQQKNLIGVRTNLGMFVILYKYSMHLLSQWLEVRNKVRSRPRWSHTLDSRIETEPEGRKENKVRIHLEHTKNVITEYKLRW